MPGSETATTTGASDIIDSLDTASLPTRTDSELRNEWNKLVLELRGATYETDLEKRHSRGRFETALELALTHPESMSVSTKPVGRRRDMTDHVRNHFDRLFNSGDWAREFKHPRPDIESLLRSCELAYLDDSVYRFSRETIIRPDLDGLEEVRFVELPSELDRWLGAVDLLWQTLAGKLEPEEPLSSNVNRLYEDRDTSVSSATEREIFLPIRSEYVDETAELKRTIKRRLSRNADVSPKLVHDYCFTRTVDRYTE